LTRVGQESESESESDGGGQAKEGWDQVVTDEVGKDDMRRGILL
jgi:hypothetical protein